MKPHRLFTLVLAGAVLCGCAVPAAIMYKTMGPPPVPARYVPAANDPLLVIVENAAAQASIPEADELGHALYLDLKDNNVAPMIDPDQVQGLRQSTPTAFARMGIAEIGRKLGAKQVLYVSLRQALFENPPGSDSARMIISARIRMVDAQSANTLWPQSGGEESLEYQSGYRRLTPDINANVLKREILAQCGVEIGRWFHQWQPENMTEENKDVRLR